MGYKVQFTNQAKKQLAKLESKQRRLVGKWIEKNLVGCENPLAIPDVKPLAGRKNGWRYRVGSYRILCTICHGKLVIDVVRVGHRRSVYGNLPKS